MENNNESPKKEELGPFERSTAGSLLTKPNHLKLSPPKPKNRLKIHTFS